ncbi:MAG: nitrate reductase cytochrome c-type subunit [Leptospirales bacterium]
MNILNRFSFPTLSIFVSCVVIFAFTALRCTSKTPLEELREKRNILRAYDGAPPQVPHSTTQTAYRRCLVCHEKGFTLKNEQTEGIADRVVGPIVPHPTWLNCVQCHVPQNTDEQFVENTFEPFRITSKKAPVDPSVDPAENAGPPPRMPHAKQNRENCKVCHASETGSLAIKSPHGEREGCEYCHVESESAIIYKDEE